MKNIEILLGNLKWFIDIWSYNGNSKTFTNLFDLHFDLNCLNNMLNKQEQSNNYLTNKYNISCKPINKDYIDSYSIRVMNKLLSINLEKVLKIPKKARLEQINDGNKRKKLIINCVKNFNTINFANKNPSPIN